MKTILVLTLSIFLTGCACFKTSDEPLIPIEKVVHIDTKMLEPCELLKEDINLSSFDQFLLTEYPEVIRTYIDCSIKQSNSIKLIKELGNIK